jgi:hypothetical protein
MTTSVEPYCLNPIFAEGKHLQMLPSAVITPAAFDLAFPIVGLFAP